SVGVAIAAAIGLHQDTKLAMAGAISVGVNITDLHTEASIRNKKSSGIKARKGVKTKANNKATIKSVAGAGAIAFAKGGKSGGVGISVAFNNIHTVIASYVSDTTIDAEQLEMKATSDGTIQSLGVAGAGAGTFALGGQLTTNWTTQRVRSYVDNSTITVDGTAGDVKIEAENSSLIQSLSGGIAIAGGDGVAVGAALAFNILNDKTKAYIKKSSVTASDGSILVSAKSTGTIETISVGISGAGQLALAGSISTAVIAGKVHAYIVDSTVDADRNVLVLAEQDGTIHSYGGAVGISVSAAGAGGALSVNVLTTDTQAYIKNSTIAARANDSTTLSVKDWDADGDETSETISGLAVIASSTEELELISVSVGFGGGGAGVGVNLAPTFVSDTTYAFIDDTNVNESTDHGGDVFVKAHEDTDVFTIIGAAGISAGGAGIGIAAEGIFVFNDTQAWITDSDTSDGRAVVYSGDDVEVSSFTRETTLTVVVGVAIASGFSGAGSVDFISLDNTNKAFISEVDVNAQGDLSVLADDVVDVIMGTGSVAASGGVAAGGSFLVTLNYNETEARIAAAHVNAKGETRVEAKSAADLVNIGVSLGAGASAAFNGVFGFYISRTDTRAIIEGGSRAAEVNRDAAYDFGSQSVIVQATDNVKQSHLMGAASAGTYGGVGGALGLIDIQNTVDAHIGSHSKVNAVDDVTVKAISVKDIHSGAAGLSLSGGLGLAGSFVITTIGSGVSSAAFDEIGTDTTNAVNSALGAVLSSTGLSQETTPDAVKNQLNSASANINATGTMDRSVEDVGAYIDNQAQITVGDDLIVEASETVTFEGKAGAVAVGGLAVGGALTSLNLKTTTEAFIDDNAVIAVGDDITVKATATETVDIFSFAGAAAASLAVGIQYSEALIDSTQSAVIDDGVQVLLADSVTIKASHTRKVDSNATGGAIAAVGAGLSEAKVELKGTVQAGTGSDVRFGQIGNSGPTGRIGSLTVEALSKVTQAEAEANAAAGGIVSGAGLRSTATVSPTVKAGLGTGTEVYSTGAVNVTAKTDIDADADGYGIAIAVGASVGGSLVSATISPSVSATVGGSAVIESSKIVIQSLHNTSDAGVATSGEAQGDTTSSGGAILLGLNGTLVTADSSASVKTEIGAANLLATTSDVVIQARSHNQADADATGVSVGIIGVGAHVSNVDITTKTEVDIKDGATIVSENGDVDLLADSTETANADATAGSGGAVAVSEA
ncbi:MAG: hypothetical protein GY722_05665, partial [bacterium]|nr:hypothetical protein [bacterium]